MALDAVTCSRQRDGGPRLLYEFHFMKFHVLVKAWCRRELWVILPGAACGTGDVPGRCYYADFNARGCLTNRHQPVKLWKFPCCQQPGTLHIVLPARALLGIQDAVAEPHPLTHLALRASGSCPKP